MKTTEELQTEVDLLRGLLVEVLSAVQYHNVLQHRAAILFDGSALIEEIRKATSWK